MNYVENIDKKPKGFIFLGDIINLPEGITEVEIVPGYFFKKPSIDQIEIIRRFVKDSGHETYYKTKFESIARLIDGHVDYTPSDNYDDWKYFVIEHDESQAKFSIQMALLIAKCDLYVLFENLPIVGRTFQQFAYQNFLSENTGVHKEKNLSTQDISEIQEIYYLLENLDGEKYGEIKKAVDDYRHLREIPSRSPFYTLGMFTILETLLTHRSEKVSITHQIKNKLNLLNNNLFEEQVNFSEFFGDVKYEKVISLLYQYRSDIAHGNNTDFNGKLQTLKNPRLVSVVIHNTLKSVIKLSLKEPKLMADLKKC
ncbi:HEPN domain-containing protein [Gracilibacillus sp. YIM 98692]|uniref:HEPN domain-containing protein n=1 Tax=Gracilibacillus sp. YIM 98692 TaxID=2663532 RepID=UPI0013D42FDC|nr:HEPN domain-containing protein [Gracilibacillus sp. YIM 98692]